MVKKASEVQEGKETNPSGSRWVVAAALAVAVVVALVLAVLDVGRQSSPTSVPADVEAVVDEYIGAQVARDVDAWLVTVTDDFFHEKYPYSLDSHELLVTLMDVEDSSRPMANRLRYLPGLEYEQVGDSSVIGEGPWYLSVDQIWVELPDERSGQLFRFEGHATYVVVERPEEFDGLRVASEIFVGTLEIVDSD